MKLRILGCSGGVGTGGETTSMLVNENMLIDAGSGVGQLTLAEMDKIERIYLTHSHLDHITFLPFILDSLFDRTAKPVKVPGLAETIAALKEHVFNWVIWPDFSVLPQVERPVLTYEVIAPGDDLVFGDCKIDMIPVHHTVPAVGYRVESNGKAFAFSGDTTTNDSFWEGLNRHSFLDLLIVEAAFPDQQIDLSQLAHHYCPSLLAEDLKKLRHQPQVGITHHKPGDEKMVYEQCEKAITGRTLQQLKSGQEFTF